jgi:predicted acylesterase/phospholipase RssA
MNKLKIFWQAVSLACNRLRGIPLGPAASEQGRRLVWQQVFDEELHEIAHYRQERPENPAAAGPADPGPREAPDLIGLAFSGGGIRSATFNLGVLEALKDLELLRRVDYLSTVSGGGYIGAWLVGNAYRRPSWLQKTADWRESIRYLRRYVNYLSPRVGLLSADTWNRKLLGANARPPLSAPDHQRSLHGE